VINTATIYGPDQHNEKLIGTVLREGDNRSKAFVITKWGLKTVDGKMVVDGAFQGRLIAARRPSLTHTHRLERLCRALHQPVDRQPRLRAGRLAFAPHRPERACRGERCRDGEGTASRQDQVYRPQRGGSWCSRSVSSSPLADISRRLL